MNRLVRIRMLGGVGAEGKTPLVYPIYALRFAVYEKIVKRTFL